VAEHGPDVADELWAAATLRIASQLVYPEARAALAAVEVTSGRAQALARLTDSLRTTLAA
jgi:hypothetical protein